MPKFVALLRGVNVGKAKRIPMADLRVLLTELGYTGVTTLLNSGNAVFHAAKGVSTKHAADIAAAIERQFQFEVHVVVKSASELATVLSENPINAKPSEHSRFLVAFVQDAKALSGMAAVKLLVIPPEQFAIGKSAAYMLCAAGILESKAGLALLEKAGGSVTTRNWATALKLHAWANEGAPNLTAL